MKGRYRNPIIIQAKVQGGFMKRRLAAMMIVRPFEYTGKSQDFKELTRLQ
jgi:hypothetical protein